MNIIEALKKTGMATKQGNYCYAKIIDVCGMSVFTWFYKHDNNQQNPVSISTIKEDDWIPYDPIPEIRPKEAGELWRHEVSGLYYCTEKGQGKENNKIVMCGYAGRGIADEMNVVHGNIWQRIHRPVEDERVEIEGLKLLPHYLETALRIMDENGTSVINSRKALPNELWEEVRKFIFTSLEISEKNR